MFDKEFFRQELKKQFNDWTDEKVETHVNVMAAKHATVKHGPNVIHLDYYHGLLDINDIQEIESDFKAIGYELSRFDKTGVLYASLEDYTLQLSYYLSDPIVQNLLLGLGTNAIWDTIKKIVIYTWQRVRSKKVVDNRGQSKTLNFGLKLQIGDNTKLDLKLDGEVSEATTLQALDKVIDLIKETKPNIHPKRERLFVYKTSNKKWVEVDVLNEIKKKLKKKK